MKVTWYFFSPVFLFMFLQSFAETKTESIRLNQIGFYPDRPKMAIVVEASAEKFFVTTPDLKDTVYSGNLSSVKDWQYSGENVQQADFSEVHENGRFVVLVPGLGYSSPFDIKPRVHQEIARMTTKAYYFQRASIELTEPFAGKWYRPMGHPDNEVLVHSSAASVERPEGTIISCPRGWYDAGDYNKYIVNSGISTYTLLAIYEHFPEYCLALNTKIPESGNTVPDVLDESLWNIRWMLTMQDPNDGGVYHKCTHANFSGVVMPHQATAPRYVVQKSSTATLDFAAVMAQSNRIFREFESELPGFADSCLIAALSAWNWARKHPHVYYRQNDNNQIYQPSITTGEYGDRNDSDEFKWAAAELYVTTHQDSFLTAVNPFSDNNTSLPGWSSVATLGFYSMAHYRKNLTAAVDTTALKNRLIQFANNIKAELSNSAYHVLITGFYWGSNAVAANQAMALIQAFRLTADSSYLNAAIENLDYLLGRNATTYCFVSGAGDKSPMHPHHRPSESDNVTDPIPGFLAGGPNPNQEDGCSGYPSDLPARSYLDEFCSYASNEICINWNAPIAYVATAVEAIESSTGKPNTISVTINSPFDDENFNTSDWINITADASISEGSIIKVEFYANNIKIGEAENAPFEFQWNEASPGVYAIQAKAVGDMSDFRYSEPVNVIIMNSEGIGNILFVVGSTNLNSGDKAIRDFLIENDYHVTIQDDNDSVAFYTEEKDAMIVSSTTGATRKIRDELLNLDVPLISWEYLMFDDFGWTGRRNNSDYGRASGSTIHILNDTHPLACGLCDNIEITTTDQYMSWAVPNENATVIACMENDTAKAAVFYYETGTRMLQDMTAKARQIGLCFSDESPATMTENGWKIFKEAIDWAKTGERLDVNENLVNIPSSHQLFQNYPNPFNPETQIHYVLNSPTHVSVVVYNIVGQNIATLVDDYQYGGHYHVQWDGCDDAGRSVSNGIYLYKMKAGDFEQTYKMIFLK